MAASEISAEVLASKWAEFGLLLQRKFWKPLGSMMNPWDLALASDRDSGVDLIGSCR